MKKIWFFYIFYWYLTGIATNNVKIEENLYPTAGMQTNGEMIDVNFGQKLFKFDIDSYRKVVYFFWYFNFGLKFINIK